MAVLRRVRRPRLVLSSYIAPALVTSLLVVLIQILRVYLNPHQRANACGFSESPRVVIASLVTPSDAQTLLSSFSSLLLPAPCLVKLYVSSTEHSRHLSRLIEHEKCAFRSSTCSVSVSLASNAQHWGHLPLNDIPSDANVIFVRPTYHISQPSIYWLQRAHESIRHHYATSARRNIAGFAIPCHPLPESKPSTLNDTCAFSPVRSVPVILDDDKNSLDTAPPEDTWAFFVTWLSARRREWLLWPHIWNELSFVPNFWKGRSRTKRDARLIWFGHRVGTDHSWADTPHYVFEHWFTRWATNFSLSVVSAPTSSIGDITHPKVIRDSDGREHIVTGLNTENDVPLGDVWPESTDPRFGEIYQSALKQIMAGQPKTVSLTMVSSKFVELTRSWLCNVQRGGFLPDHVHWITLDEPSKLALDQLNVGKTIDLTGAITGDNMDVVSILYGQPSYWRLMLLRTRLIRDLLDRGVDVFLFETDQVWLQDPMKFVRKELRAGADMVGTLDTQHNIAGNTIFLRSVLATRRMWSEVYTRFLASYEEKRIDNVERNSETFVQHDQYQLSDLLMFNTEFRQDYPVALGLLNSQLFVGGSWYSGFYSSEESKRPIVINNNFISGTEKKKSRAIVFGHWFVQYDNRTCDLRAVDKALRYEFARLPGKWWIAGAAHDKLQ